MCLVTLSARVLPLALHECLLAHTLPLYSYPRNLTPCGIVVFVITPLWALASFWLRCF
ncbi:hypothetical protein BDR03DRAFT_948072 [Suillus americanus]|nr:hypothetical protein BDR03DRAFT_948072 [Suillus americanus]